MKASETQTYNVTALWPENEGIIVVPPMTNKQKSTDEIELGKGDVLLISDIQNDFQPGGSLGVLEGDQVIRLEWLY
jgi:hypothetical protein